MNENMIQKEEIKYQIESFRPFLLDETIMGFILKTKFWSYKPPI